MATEVRNLAEGTLRWVECSGDGLGWQTGDSVATATDTAAWAARSGLIGYVQAGMGFQHPQNWAAIMDRGVVSHQKLIDTPPSELRFTVLAGITGDYPSGLTGVGPSALGHSQPGSRFNFEFKQLVSEDGPNTGLYYQFHKAVILNKNFTEQPEGNTKEFTIRADSAIGPTASGYLS